MIVIGLSSAQLDTVDPYLNSFLAEHGADVARYLAILETCESGFSRLRGRMSPLSLAFMAIAETGQRTKETLELSVLAFEVPMLSPLDSRPRSNPTAPIPDRLRRRADRNRG